MSIRRRLSPEESRAAALDAARALLIEAGPQAVTLKAVATRIGRTHANLLHHFGSAAGLQKALAAHIAGTVCDAISEAIREDKAGDGLGVSTQRRAVDLAFDAFDREGGGALASWMLLSGNEDALDPIVETIHQLVDELHPQEGAHGVDRTMHEATYTLVLLALGDALMGERLAESLKVDRATSRERATAMVVASLARMQQGRSG